MSRFPERLLVKIVSEPGEDFMLAGETPADLGVDISDGPVQVARYILVGVGRVNTVSEYVELENA